jgi:acyl carrier protein
MSDLSERRSSLSSSQASVAPRTPVESELAAIWAEVLGVERVGIHDNIFELGGGSLLATQVVSIVLDAFQVKLPLRILFESPTVAGMAAFIEEQQSNVIGDEELHKMVAELEELSDEEIERLLLEEGGSIHGGAE